MTDTMFHFDALNISRKLVTEVDLKFNIFKLNEFLDEKVFVITETVE